VDGGPPHDRDLTLRAQRGDGDAFAALVAPHREVAFRLAYVIAGTAGDAEDAAQDGLVKAWQALGRFRAGEPFRPWLLRIVANEARNRRRSSGRRVQLALRVAAAPVEAGDDADRHALLEALRALPDDAQAVLTCRYLLGLSEQETAAALDVAPGTVKSRTSRALERLRVLYG
jgi:RNA polymerase sigma factor (sigma-70 family)